MAVPVTAVLVRVQETYRSVDSRMAQESLRRYVLRVLRVWRSWFIFSDDYLNGLQVRSPHPCQISNRDIQVQLYNNNDLVFTCSPHLGQSTGTNTVRKEGA